MKLDRTTKGRGKYAVINLRKLDALRPFTKPTADPQTFAPGALPPSIREAINTLERAGLINYGEPGTENEFFVMMLKDKFAGGALYQYANEAATFDYELSCDVRELSRRAGRNSPFCKDPD